MTTVDERTRTATKASDPAAVERERLERAWPEAFRDGVRAAYSLFPADHERGGYPREFSGWPLEKRNSYFAGYNWGFIGRRRARDRARHG
jgi:hypothetical protein